MGIAQSELGTANAVVYTEIAAQDGVTQEIESYGGGFDVAPSAAAYLTVESPPGTILQRWPITAAGPAPMPNPGSCIKGVEGEALRVSLEAGGGSAVGCVNLVSRP